MRKALRVCLLAALGIAGAMLLFDVCERVVFGARPGNRLAVYAIQQEMRKGIPKEEVAKVIARHQAKHVRVRWDTTSKGETLYLWTPLGLFHDGGCQLSGTFVDDKLVSSRVRGTEGPDERFPDAPPDIE